MKKLQQICLFTIAMMVCSLLPAEQGSVGLTEWSDNCVAGFKLSAMPSHWHFNPEVTELTVVTHVAIDYLTLPEDSYEVVTDGEDGQDGEDPLFNLSAYSFMALKAEIRSKGTVIRSLPGTYSVYRGKEPVVFTWDGLDAQGKKVSPGFFEIEIRGRFVPVETGLRAEDGFTYQDFDDWLTVDEACSRTLAVEVIEEIRDPWPPVRGVTCAPPDASYYATVDSTNATTLRATLHPVIDDHTRFPYSSTSTDTWDVLNDADENPSNDTQLLTLYKNEAHADGCTTGCQWNREHTWAKSFGFSEDSGNGRIPYTDCHHLRAANASYNSARGNKPFQVCDGCTSEYATDANNGFGGGANDVNLGSGGSIFCGGTPTVTDRWEAWDHRKGDVARTILYMDIRYEGGTGSSGDEQDLIATSDLSLMMVEKTSDTCPGSNDGYQDPAYHGVLSTLLAWSLADPVDADEMRRNGQVWCYQGNRNPFVDHPEWIPCLYEDQCSGISFGGIGAATDLDLCAVTGVQIDWNTPTAWDDGCIMSCSRGFLVYRDGTQITTGGCGVALGEGATTCVDDTGAAGVTYAYSVEAFNNLDDTGGGAVTINQADLTDDDVLPLITVGPNTAPTQALFTATWTTDKVSDSHLTWGTSPGAYTSWEADSALVTDHSLVATGLTPETLYYFRVCSTDRCGNGPACSAETEVSTLGDPGADAQAFINELHYDNLSTDANEGVEIAGTAGVDLAGWTIAVYNGNGGTLSGNMSPNPVPLSGTLGDEGGGFGALWFDIAGLENGSPDGVAFVDDEGTLLQFLCYEGSFAATEGPASGLTCTDIGVEESYETTADQSLQMTGGPGCAYTDFTWVGPLTNSRGFINSGQTIECTSDVVFSDGFESGDTMLWSASAP